MEGDTEEAQGASSPVFVAAGKGTARQAVAAPGNRSREVDGVSSTDDGTQLRKRRKRSGGLRQEIE